MNNNDELSRPVAAPTYNELINLVSQLREQVEQSSARSVTPPVERVASPNSLSIAR